MTMALAGAAAPGGRLRPPPDGVIKSHFSRMKVHDHCDCSCHAPGARDVAGDAANPPSTGFFVLSLSLALLLCGLISTGVIPLRFW